MVRTATYNTETSIGSEEDIVRSANAKDGAKADFTKADNNADNLFIEDVCISRILSVAINLFLTILRLSRRLSIIMGRASSACGLRNTCYGSCGLRRGLRRTRRE